MNAVISTIPGFSTPYRIGLSPEGDIAYVTNSGSNSVSMIDTATNTVTGSIAVGTTPTGIATFNSRITWQEDADGSWNTATQWYPQISPENTSLYFGSAGAQFLDILTAPRTITIDTTATVDRLYFRSSEAYTIAAALNQKLILSSTPFISIAAGDGAHEISAPIEILEPLSIQQETASNFTISGVISGSQPVSIATNGTVIFKGENTYTGATTISSGTLALDTAGALSNSTALTVTGTFDISAANGDRSVGTLAGGGDVVLGSRTLITEGSGSTVYSGEISGAGGFTKQGTGTLTFTGTNSYLGTSTISEGILIGNTTSLQGSSSRSVVNNGTLIFDQATDDFYNGLISGTGTLIKQNNGTVIFSGENTYTGATTISSGTLALDTAGTLSNSTALTVTGTFDISAANGDRSIGTLAGAGDVVLGSRTLITEGSGSTVYSGEMSGAGGFTKQGTGTLIFTGTNSYLGTSTISEGILIGNTTSLQGSSSRSIVNNGTLIFDQATDDFYNGFISGTGTLIKQNSGSLRMERAFSQNILNVTAGSLIEYCPV